MNKILLTIVLNVFSSKFVFADCADIVTRIPTKIQSVLSEKKIVFIGESHGSSLSIVDQSPIIEAALCTQRRVVFVLEGPFSNQASQQVLDNFISQKRSFEDFDRDLSGWFSTLPSASIKEAQKKIYENLRDNSINSYFMEGNFSSEGGRASFELLEKFIPTNFVKLAGLPNCEEIKSPRKRRKCVKKREPSLYQLNASLDNARKMNRDRDEKMAMNLFEVFKTEAQQGSLVIVYSGGVHTAQIPAFMKKLGVPQNDMAEIYLGNKRSNPLSLADLKNEADKSGVSDRYAIGEWYSSTPIWLAPSGISNEEVLRIFTDEYIKLSHF